MIELNVAFEKAVYDTEAGGMISDKKRSNLDGTSRSHRICPKICVEIQNIAV